MSLRLLSLELLKTPFAGKVLSLLSHSISNLLLENFQLRKKELEKDYLRFVHKNSPYKMQKHKLGLGIFYKCFKQAEWDPHNANLSFKYQNKALEIWDIR